MKYKDKKAQEEPPKPEVAQDADQKPGDGIAPRADKIRIPEAEQLRKKLEESLSQNLIILQDALNKTPEKSRTALIKAIETSNKTREQIQHEIDENDNSDVAPIGNGDKAPESPSISDNATDTQKKPGIDQLSSDNTTIKNGQNGPVRPSTDNTTNTGKTPSRDTSSSDNTTDAGTSLKNNQPSPYSTALVSDNVTKPSTDS